MGKKLSMAAFAAVFMLVALGGQASAGNYNHSSRKSSRTYPHTSYQSEHKTDYHKRYKKSHNYKRDYKHPKVYKHTTKKVNRYGDYHHKAYGDTYHYKPVVHKPVYNYTCYMRAMDANHMSTVYHNGDHVPVGTNVWLGAHTSHGADSYDWYVKHNGHWVKQPVYGHEWDYTVWEAGMYEFKVVPKHGSLNCACYFSVYAY